MHYMHHEQACAMAAEGYARIHWRPAAVCVTAGPGAINALNGVFGAFTDSVPMIVISGQPRTETLVALSGVDGLRQLGDQESPIATIVSSMVKEVQQVQHAAEIPAALDALVALANEGRPGPVWLDVPVDVQARDIDADPFAAVSVHPEPLAVSAGLVSQVLDLLEGAARPLILAGTGVRASGTVDDLRTLSQSLGVPVSTAWTHDIVDAEDPLFAGRPGTIGTRAGNMVLQAADVVLVLGSRLNIRQVGYAWDQFAPNAQLLMIDVDAAELAKPYLHPALTVQADLRAALPQLVEAAGARSVVVRDAWPTWVRDVRSRYEPKPSDYLTRESGINPYHFVAALDESLPEDAIVVSGNASACIVPFQMMAMTGRRRLFSNSGAASMGYDLPAALGAAIAAPDQPVVCLAGDGSLMMNMQELQTLRAWAPDIKLFVLENRGYLSIRQTQQGFFGGEAGAGPDSGVTFPDFADVARAFALPVWELYVGADWRQGLSDVLGVAGPAVCVVHLDPEQGFEPRLRSRMTAQGIVSPALDDMYPYLSEGELEGVRESAPKRDN